MSEYKLKWHKKCTVYIVLGKNLVLESNYDRLKPYHLVMIYGPDNELVRDSRGNIIFRVSAKYDGILKLVDSVDPPHIDFNELRLIKNSKLTKFTDSNTVHSYYLKDKKEWDDLFKV